MEEPAFFESGYLTDSVTVHRKLKCNCSVSTVAYCSTCIDHVGSSSLFINIVGRSIHYT